MANNKVLIHTTAITFDWEDVAGATKYKLQVSKYIDFSSFELNTEPVPSTKAHVITGGVGKYYWRWRAFVGSYNENYPWREVSSFIYDDAMFAGFTAIPNWVMINKNVVTEVEKFQFQVEPLDWEIEEPHLYKVKKRNLKGEILSEYKTTKGMLKFDLSQQAYIGQNQKAEFQRFYNLHTSFYICRQFEDLDNVNKVSRIWEVEFESSLQMEKLGGLTLDLEEV